MRTQTSKIARGLRVFAYALLAFFVLDIAACQIFDALFASRDPAGAVRAELPTQAGWTLSYLRNVGSEPDAPRIIFVHGTPGDANAFRGYIEDPLDGFESISIDRPGFGRTRPRRPALTLREQAACIAPLLERRGGMWPILVGHSLGGPIVVQAALDYPDRIGGLVIVSGSLDPALEKVGWYQQVADVAFFPYTIPRAVRHSNRELLPMKAQLAQLAPRLPELAVPVIILHARNDMLVPYENVQFMLGQFPDEYVVDVMDVEGKNHFIPWNAEAEVREGIARVAQAARERSAVERVPP